MDDREVERQASSDVRRQYAEVFEQMAERAEREVLAAKEAALLAQGLLGQWEPVLHAARAGLNALERKESLTRQASEMHRVAVPDPLDKPWEYGG